MYKPLASLYAGGMVQVQTCHLGLESSILSAGSKII